jgi:pimeloyl-ACP methyl ester carboxylesterase
VALPLPDDDEEAAASYPGASAPDRSRFVDASGLGLAVHEWGEPDGAPVLFAHGGFDFARTYDLFAPLLAAEGWRVVAWDQRGHGDSEHAALYNWEADVRDGLTVLDTVTTEPLPVLGHSKGGGLMLQLADACPHRVRAVVNLDGLPSRRRSPDVPDHERTRLLAGELAGWLDHRRTLVGKARKPGTIDELARRRARMNPRLSREWLRYLVTAGARRDPDGWRWKIDPTMRFGGFGPWRPEWSMLRLVGLGMPFLGLLGMEPEEMGWGTQPADVQKYLPAGAHFEAMQGVGHFLHIERPQEVAELVLDFLGPAR